MPAPDKSPAQAIAVDADRPWLGLASFTEATQRFFFGRDKEIAEIYVRVREQGLTVLYGQSGLGKTSLLGAGLIPKLKVENFQPVLVRLRYEPSDPPLIRQVFDHLAAHGLAPVNDGTTTLWEWLHHLPERSPVLDERPPVVIFDQFEEIFTLGQRADRLDEAREFFSQIADVVENRAPAELRERFQSDRKLAREYDHGQTPLRLVITLREDYLSHLEQWKKIMPSLMRNRMGLTLLGGLQALEAVVRPGNLEGRHLVDHEVAASIVRFVAKRPESTPLEQIDAVPPLLSLVCDELNRLRIEDRLPSITPELVETQSADILHTFYEQSFADQPAALRRLVEDRLITEGGHRSPVARDDALSMLQRAGAEDPAGALDSLIARRLVSPEERGGLQWLEITHDVLSPLVAKSRDERLERERAQLAKEREEAGRRTRRKLVGLVLAFGFLAVLAIIAAAAAFAAFNKAKAATAKARIAETEKAEQYRVAKESQKMAEESLGRVKRKETDELMAGNRYLEAGASLAQADAMSKLPERKWLQMSMPRPMIKLLGRMKLPGEIAAARLAASPDSPHLAMLTSRGTLEVLDERTGAVSTWVGASPSKKLLWAVTGSSPPPGVPKLTAMAFDPTRPAVLALVEGFNLVVIDLAAGEELSRTPILADATPGGGEDASGGFTATPGGPSPDGDPPVTALAFDPEEPVLYGGAGRRIYRWKTTFWEPDGSSMIKHAMFADRTVEPISGLAVCGGYLGVTMPTTAVWAKKNDISQLTAYRPGTAVPFRPIVSNPAKATLLMESLEAAPGLVVIRPASSKSVLHATTLTETRALAVHPGGDLVIGGLADGTLSCWRTNGLPQVLPAHGESVSACEFRRDGRIFYTTDKSGMLAVWEVPEPAPEISALEALGRQNISAAFAADGGSRIASSFGWLQQGEDRGQKGGRLAFSNELRVTLSPGGRLVAGYRLVNSKGESGGWLTVHDLDADKQLAEWPADESVPETIAFSPALDRIGYIRGDGDVEVRSLTGDNAFFRLPVESGIPRNTVAFSADGLTLAIGYAQNKVEFWKFLDPQARPISTPVVAQGASSLAYSADGGHLAIGGNTGDVFIWDIADQKMGSIGAPGNTAVTAIGFLPENRIITGLSSGEVAVRDRASGRLFARLTVGTGAVKSLEYDSRTGRILATFALSPPLAWRVPDQEPSADEILKDGGFQPSPYLLVLREPSASFPATPPVEVDSVAVLRKLAAFRSHSRSSGEWSAGELETLLQPFRELKSAAAFRSALIYGSFSPLVEVPSPPDELGLVKLQGWLNGGMTEITAAMQNLTNLLLPEGPADPTGRVSYMRLKLRAETFRNLPAGAAGLPRLKDLILRDLNESYRTFKQGEWDKELLAGIVSDREREAIYLRNDGPHALVTRARDKIPALTADSSGEQERQLIDRALAQDPRHPAALFASAELEEKLGRHAAAAAAYQRILDTARVSIPYDTVAARLRMARAMVRESDTKETRDRYIEICTRALAVTDSRNALDANLLVAEFASQIGLAKFSYRTYSTALALAENNNPKAANTARFAMARLLSLNGETAAAARQLKDALAKSGMNSAALRDEGYRLYSNGSGRYNHELAIAHLETSLAMDPDDKWTLNYLGIAHRERGEFEIAIDYLLRSIRKDPSNPYAAIYLCPIYRRLGRFEEAWDLIDGAVRQLTESGKPDIWVLAERADLLRQMARYENAEIEYDAIIERTESAISQAPDDSKRTEERANLESYRLKRAICIHAAGRKQEAIDEISAIAAGSQRPTSACLELANLQAAAGVPLSERQTHLEKAAAEAGWLNDWVVAKALLGRFDDSLVDLHSNLINGTKDQSRLHLADRWAELATFYAIRSGSAGAADAQAALLCFAQAVLAGWSDGETLDRSWVYHTLKEDPRFRLLARALRRDASHPLRHYELAVYFAEMAEISRSIEHDFNGTCIPFVAFTYPPDGVPFEYSKHRRSGGLTEEERADITQACLKAGVKSLATAFIKGLGDHERALDEPALAALRKLENASVSVLAARKNILLGMDHSAAPWGYEQFATLLTLAEDADAVLEWTDPRFTTIQGESERVACALQTANRTWAPEAAASTIWPQIAGFSTLVLEDRMDRGAGPMLALLDLAGEKFSDPIAAAIAKAQMQLLLGNDIQAVEGFSAAHRMAGDPSDPYIKILKFLGAQISFLLSSAPEERLKPLVETLASWKKGLEDMAEPRWYVPASRAFLIQGRADLAMEFAEAGLKNHPEFLPLISWKAKLLRITGQTEQATSFLDGKLAEAGQPRNGNLSAEAGLIYASLGRNDRAKELFTEALGMESTGPAAERLARIGLGTQTKSDLAQLIRCATGETHPAALLALARYHSAEAAKNAAGTKAWAEQRWMATFWLGMGSSSARDEGWLRLDPVLRALIEEKPEIPADADSPVRNFMETNPAPVFAASGLLPWDEERIALQATAFARLWKSAAGLGIDPRYVSEALFQAAVSARSLKHSAKGASAFDRLVADPAFASILAADDPAVSLERMMLSYPDPEIGAILREAISAHSVAGVFETDDTLERMDLKTVFQVDDKPISWNILPSWLSDDGKVKWTLEPSDTEYRQHAEHWHLAATFTCEGKPWKIVLAVPKNLRDSPSLQAVIQREHFWKDQGANRRLAALWESARAKSAEAARTEISAADAARTKGDLKAAYAAYERARVLWPASDELYERSKAATAIGKSEEAARSVGDMTLANTFIIHEWRLSGWSLLNLGKIQDALAAFKSAEKLGAAFAKEQDNDLSAGIAICSWKLDLKDEAIAAYHKMIQKDAKWRKPETIANLKWPAEESVPLEAVRAATTEKHPEEAPAGN